MKLIFFVLLLMLLGLQTHAKRKAPSDVKPIVWKGVEYSAPHFVTEGMSHNGGYIEAKDVKTKKRIWLKEVYPVVYDKKIELDVQDIFINSIKLKGKNLIITNESGKTLKLSIK